jgi:hypothetical protein
MGLDVEELQTVRFPRTPHQARTVTSSCSPSSVEGGAGVTVGCPTIVADELRTIEGALHDLRVELAAVEQEAAVPPPKVHRAWITQRLERLDELLRADAVRAKAEIVKHLDGDLIISPRPEAARRHAEISGRAKLNSLLGGQEAVYPEVVAGAGFAECYTESPVLWIDLIP